MRRVKALSLLLALLLLAGCVGEGAASSGGESGSSSVASVPAASRVPAESPASEPTAEEAAEAALAEARQDLIDRLPQLTERCQRVIDGFPEITLDPGRNRPAYQLTSTHKEKLCEALADEGVSATFDNRLITHPEQALAFYQDYRDGKEASWMACGVGADGLNGQLFYCNGGTLWDFSFLTEFPALTASSEVSVSVTDLEWATSNNEMHFSPRGFLMIGEEDWYNSYRVAYVDPAFYALRERYVDPIFYSHMNLYHSEWSVGHLEEIPWDFAFDALYGYEIGRPEDYQDRDVPIGTLTDPVFARPLYDETNRYAVEASLYERVLTDYFPVTREQLRTLDNYMPEERAYAWQPYIGGGGPFEIEVIDYLENEDGSLTITAIETALYFGVDNQHFCFALTVRDRPDGGFVYLANEILEGEPAHRDGLSYLEEEPAAG